MGFAQGFRHFSAFPKSLDAETILKRLDELRPELQAKGPYFLYLHFMDVHGPYRPRAPLYDGTLVGEVERKISAYDSGIRALDERLRQAFAACGWQKDTLVLVTADHGEELGDRGSWGHGATLFGEVLDVPLLVYPPGGTPARRNAERVSLIDVLPTLREVARLPPAAADRGPEPAAAHRWPARGARASHSLCPPVAGHGPRRERAGPQGRDPGRLEVDRWRCPRCPALSSSGGPAGTRESRARRARPRGTPTGSLS